MGWDHVFSSGPVVCPPSWSLPAQLGFSGFTCPVTNPGPSTLKACSTVPLALWRHPSLTLSPRSPFSKFPLPPLRAKNLLKTLQLSSVTCPGILIGVIHAPNNHILHLHLGFCLPFMLPRHIKPTKLSICYLNGLCLVCTK